MRWALHFWSAKKKALLFVADQMENIVEIFDVLVLVLLDSECKTPSNFHMLYFAPFFYAANFR